MPWIGVVCPVWRFLPHTSQIDVDYRPGFSGYQAVFTDFTQHCTLRSSGSRRAALELNQPAHIVNQVHHADLHLRTGHADGADELAAHRTLLKAKHMLDANPYLRGGPVGISLSLVERLATFSLMVDVATIAHLAEAAFGLS